MPVIRRPRRRSLVVLVALALLAGVLASAPAAQAQSTTIYVAPNGSDDNPGTRARPKYSLVSAMLALPQGGDILMRGGTYRYGQSQSGLWRGGTRERPLVIKSVRGERARIVSSSGANCVLALGDFTRVRNIDCTGSEGIMAYGANNVIFAGNYVHDLTASYEQGINVSGGSSNIIIRNNRVQRVPHTGIAIGDTEAYSSRNVTVEGNRVRQANYQFRNRAAWEGGWGSGISVIGVDGARILRNDVRRTWGEGINCPLSNNCSVRRNVVVDAWNALFYADNATNSVWEDNVAKTTNDPRFERDYGFGGFQASGFMFGNERGWYQGAGNPGNNNIVRNNIVINAHRGVGFLDFGVSGGFRNTRIANNTFVRVLCGTDFQANGGNAGNEFVNNIVVPSSNGRPTCSSTSGVTWRNNLWASGNAGAARHSSDVRGNPGFVRGTGLRPASYRLAPGSAAIDAGRTVSYVGDDKRNRDRPRGGAYDIGAFEY